MQSYHNNGGKNPDIYWSLRHYLFQLGREIAQANKIERSLCSLWNKQLSIKSELTDSAHKNAFEKKSTLLP